MSERDGRDGIEARVKMLERRMDELDALVDGHEPWSHRSKLHGLKDQQDTVRVAGEALQAYRDQRNSIFTRVREWGSFALAAVAFYLAVHGG